MFQQFRFTPNPNLVNQSIGGGIANGANLVGILNERRDRSRLQEIAELARQGIDTPKQANAVGSALIGLGQVGSGLRAINNPFQREQARQQQEFQNLQLQGLLGHRNRQFELQQATADRAAQQQQFDNELALSRLGLDQQRVEIASQPAPPTPQTAVARINQDLNNGLIDEAAAIRLRANATAPKNGITINKDGTVQIGGSRKPPTEGQAKANIFANRMEESNQILDALETEGTNFLANLTSRVPIVGNFTVSPAFRQYDQAKRDFINATLRQESGAVISPAEFANAEKQYFPQPGDDVVTINNKRNNRRIALESIRQASGPFSNQTPRTQPETNGPTINNAPDVVQPVSNEELNNLLQKYNVR